MLACPAEGCEFTAKSDRALTVHLGRCKRAASGLTLVAEDVERYETERRQVKRRRIPSPERLEEVGEPMDVDLEVSTANDESESGRLTVVIVLSGEQPASRLPSPNRRTSTPY
jgi:hypothetical protein